MKIIILGPQGSGKGTQAALLAKKLGLRIISPGVIYREEIKRNTVLGRRIAPLINAGKFAPNILTNKIVKQRLLSKLYKRGAILDGYPRNLNQAKFLHKYWKPEHVVLLDLSQKEIIKRLSGRLVCIGCGALFHKIYKPSKLKKLYDACKGKLERRADDAPAVIRTRLRIYKHETLPVIDFYEKLGLVRKIKGKRTIEEVWEEIQKMLRVE